MRLYCHSPGREQKEQAINARFITRFEAGLQKLTDGLTRPRGEKRLDRLQERIGRLKASSHGIGQHDQVELEADATGQKAIALRWQQQPVAGTMLTDPGVYCLRSNETGWGEEALWRTYRMLTDLEAVFRSFKPVLSPVEGSELGLRPVFHHKENRVDGHLFITVLAYQFVQIVRRQLKDRGIKDRWGTLREIMGSQCRITATFQRADGRILHVRKATRAEPEALAIYQALNIDPAPGGIVKMLV